jgi:hypothetical protein
MLCSENRLTKDSMTCQAPVTAERTGLKGLLNLPARRFVEAVQTSVAVCRVPRTKHVRYDWPDVKKGLSAGFVFLKHCLVILD